MKRERITITILHDIIKKVDTVIDGQKIRNRSNAIETLLGRYFKEDMVKTAVLLGNDPDITIRGKIIPELLIPIKNKTLAEKNIEKLKECGVEDFIIVVNKENKEQITKKLGNGEKYNASISYLEADNKKTAKPIEKLKSSLINGTFMVVNGDILLEPVDLIDMHDFHKKNNGLTTIAVAVAKDSTKLGSIFMKGHNILDFKEKATESKHQSHLINGGIYIFEPEALAFVNEKTEMLEHDVFPILANTGKLLGYQVGRKWYHLHSEKEYNEYLEDAQ